MECFKGRARQLIFCPVLVVAIGSVAIDGRASGQDETDQESLGPPNVYTELKDAIPVSAGRVRNQQFIVDRFTFDLEDGELYVVDRKELQATVAVYLGKGHVRAFPPDGVELHQIRKLIDEDFLDEDFSRFVFWLTGDLSERVLTLAAGQQGQEFKNAVDLLKERREQLVENQLINPDARVVADLWHATVAPSLASQKPRPYFFADIDGRNHDWFSIEVEPRSREEVTVWRFDRRRKISNIWMSFHALDNFKTDKPIANFPRDPNVDGPLIPTATAERDNNDNWSAADYGLLPRVAVPEREPWSPRVTVSRTDVDIAIQGNGEVQANVALSIEPLEPISSVRLLVSQFVEVTDVRWQSDTPMNINNVLETHLLSTSADGERPADEPPPITGDPLHYVQEKHDRFLDDDLHEPWLTVFLPESVPQTQQFILRVTYKGELVQKLPVSQAFVLKDTITWIPRHPDNRKRRLDLTFRIPERLRIASGGSLATERVDDGTRIMRWILPTPVRGTMAFQLGRFEVNEVTADGLPPIAVYADRNHLGFAPGNRAKTITDLINSIRTYEDYFGPYPFESLLVTETAEYGGQAFPGLVLLTFQAFGELHTGESELFRSHEVAHQWWGASIDWEDYRDQWLSEGFAHYAGALYALVGLNDTEQFQQMLDAWRYDVVGEVNVGQGFGLVRGLQRYGLRPEVIRESDGNESGPVVVGSRLITTDTPFDYRVLVYEKGAFILHMLRMLLLDLETESDEKFREMMREFASEHQGGVASTATFESAVTRVFGEPMDWFFDQWVYGVDVPTYDYDLAVTPIRDSSEPFLLHGTIRQDNVPEGFRMAVPIRLEFEAHKPLLTRIWVDKSEIDVEIKLPANPVKIDFNYQHGVLTNVR